MQKIFFNGYYGYSNTGDNSFMEVAAWGAKEIWNSKNIFFQTPSSDNLPILEHKASFYKKKYFKGFLRLQQTYQIYSSTRFVTAGGSVFQKQLKQNDIKSTILRLRKGKNTKVGAMGVSIGPFRNKTEETKIIEYLKRLDFLTVRDQRSYELCKLLSLPYETINASDLAALLPLIYKCTSIKRGEENANKIIGVSYCNYERYHGENVEIENNRKSNMIALLNSLLRDHNNQINFFIFNGHKIYGDDNITKEIITELRPARLGQINVVNFDQNVRNTWENVRKCDVFVSTRLHAAVFACFADVPFFLIEYHKKCSDFLDDIGQANRYRIMDGKFEIDQIAHEINNILYHNKYDVPLNLQEVKDRSILNFEGIKDHFHES